MLKLYQRFMKTKKILLGVGFLLFFIFIFKTYYRRIGAFGCFDDCFNYVAAYFMLKGKTLYSEIFFNHQPLMAWLSWGIQKLFHPKTLYQLIAYHRVFIFLTSFLMDIFLIFRFGWPGIGFALFYEPTKYYLFGDRFLGEAVIVYPLVYLLGLGWYKFQKKTIFTWEFILSAIFTWFVVFAREPYVPVAIFVYVLILWGEKFSKDKLISIILFILLSSFTLLSLPLPDYLFNVIKINSAVEVKTGEIFGIGIFKIFAYPIYLFFGGKWNFFRLILIGLDIVFLSLAGFFVTRKKELKKIMMIILILGLANIRFVTPGTVFYEAFHMTPWYGLFLMTIFLLLIDLSDYQKSKPIIWISLALLILVFGYAIFSPQAFIWERVNKEGEFNTSYGNYFVNGEVIRLLANPNDTLFVEMWEDLIYWQANLLSPYKYSWYTSVMPYFPKYTEAREEMFVNNPPDFYYGDCPKETYKAQSLPDYRINDYTQLYFAGKPTCLYIKKTKLAIIEKERWEKVKKFGFYLP